jgi:hypothetical protein
VSSTTDLYTVESLLIRYEGKDADRHVIDMMALGESMQGFGRIYSVVGHFVATGTYAKQWQALEVRAFATEPKAKCFQLAVELQSIMQSQLMSGLAGSIITAIVSYIVARNSNKGEEMRHLRELLEKQLDSQTGRNDKTTDRLLLTIEKLADSLRSSLKQAVAPVGQTCRSIDLIPSPDSKAPSISIDEATKDAILSEDDDSELTGLKSFTVIITEMDKERGTIKVRLLGQDGEPEPDEDGSSRVNAKIIDPAFDHPANAYIRHFASGDKLEVKGKASLKEGVIRQLYLSDAG